jgi:Phage Mu protein F like protein
MAESVVGAALAALDAPLSDSEFWSAFDQKAVRQEPAYRHIALTLFDQERASSAARIETAVPAGKATGALEAERQRQIAAAIALAIEGAGSALRDPYLEAALLRILADYAPGGAYHAAWLARYRALIGSTVQLGGAETAAAVGLSFHIQNPAAIAAIQRRVTNLAGNVSATTAQRVRDVIAEGLRIGSPISRIAEEIRTIAFNADITANRAQTIARTETVGALNEGSFLGATGSGVMHSKRWISQRDARVRETHAEEDNGVWIGLQQPFPVTSLQYPHDPSGPPEEVINCRCTLIYSDLSPAEANSP